MITRFGQQRPPEQAKEMPALAHWPIAFFSWMIFVVLNRVICSNLLRHVRVFVRGILMEEVKMHLPAKIGDYTDAWQVFHLTVRLARSTRRCGLLHVHLNLTFDLRISIPLGNTRPMSATLLNREFSLCLSLHFRCRSGEDFEN